MASTPEARPHSITLENRSRLLMSGAVNVENFEENSMNIETTMGTLALKGGGLHIIKFDTEAGELIIEGEFDSFGYTASAGKGGFFSKLFG